MTDRTWQFAVYAAIAVYCLWAALLILQNPGLQYDEALLVLGGVQMRNSPRELGLPHDPDTWFRAFHRWFPLMTVRYVGALKDYLSLPLFAVFGTGAPVSRRLSTFLGALGIWGIARLIGVHVGWKAGAIVAAVIAMNPAYAATTVFDNGTVAIWMGALGLLCVAVTRYLRTRTATAAFWVGAAMGLGVWARANFLWQIAALLAATLIVTGKRFLSPLSHWAALLAGGLFGGGPFLIYQIRSKGGTWTALSMFALSDSLRQRMYARLVFLSETLLSDREHRAMWNGPEMPDWQPWLFMSIVTGACGVCLIARRGGERVAALTFLFLGALLFRSEMPVSEHHLIVLVPIAAVLVVFACTAVASRYRKSKPFIVVLAATYVGCALYWQVASIRGLHKSGGVGQWSDGIFELERILETTYGGREIKILDWGLQNNLFVLSDSKLHTREVFGDELREESGKPWTEEVRTGGVFVLNGPGNRNIPASSLGFLRALAELRPVIRQVRVSQRNDATYAAIIEVEPHSGQDAPGRSVIQTGLSTNVSIGDAKFEKQLDGFYPIESGGWRWTKGRFAVFLGTPDMYEAGDVRLLVNLTIPDASIHTLGPIALTARIGSHVLKPETYHRPGSYTFNRYLQPSWLNATGPNRIDFSLDKTLPATRESGRELGIVVLNAGLESN